jgi:transcriptional regulator with GAF, ATPase, and Fis domain
VSDAAATRLVDALHERARQLTARTTADACVISRVLGDVLIIVARVTADAAPLELGQGFLVSDYPATEAVLRTGEPAVLTLADDDVDAAEAQLLRDIGYAALMMLPLEVVGERWGLIELYRRAAHRFDADEVAAAQALARVDA